MPRVRPLWICWKARRIRVVYYLIHLYTVKRGEASIIVIEFFEANRTHIGLLHRFQSGETDWRATEHAVDIGPPSCSQSLSPFFVSASAVVPLSKHRYGYKDRNSNQEKFFGRGVSPGKDQVTGIPA